MKKWTIAEEELLEKLWEKPKVEIQKAFPDKKWGTIKTKAHRLGLSNKIVSRKTDEEYVNQDITLSKLKTENKRLKKQYKASLKLIENLNANVEASVNRKIEINHLEIFPKSNTGEATAFMIASDWHVGEVVRPEMVSGLNEFNPTIAKERIDKFFKNSLSLYNNEKQAINIPTIVLALLGDFLHNNLHEDSAENASMLPMEELMFVQNKIASGIQFYLDNTDAQIIIPCASGNHARTTKKLHISSEYGNSLEYIMYHNLANYFSNEKRIKFFISMGYHTYINVYDAIIRMHHGHFIKYSGGVGGIYIPVNKAIAQWNKMKKADLDLMGHYHQQRDGGNFICNGSLIGYNPYALSIKADYEQPKQQFFLWDRKRGKTIVAPILVNGIKE